MRCLANRFVLLLLAFFLLQVAYWHHTWRIVPKMEVVTMPPGPDTLKVLSFGDPQFLFRYLTYTLSTMGDTFGRSTPLSQYNMQRVYLWASAMDTLDDESNVVPTLAAYYFAKTQKTEKARYMVDYLYEHASKRPEKKWWWLTQAAYIARHVLKDEDLALKVSTPLIKAEGIPMWARQIPAFIHEGRGEFDDALHIMETILNHAEEIPPSELKFMRYFVEERIHKIDEIEEKAGQRIEKPRDSSGKN